MSSFSAPSLRAGVRREVRGSGRKPRATHLTLIPGVLKPQQCPSLRAKLRRRFAFEGEVKATTPSECPTAQRIQVMSVLKGSGGWEN